MNKSIFGLIALILAFPAFSDETRINTTRDSGSYEASLRTAGIPLSGGLAWATHGTNSGTVELVASKPAPTQVAVAKPAKNS